MSDETMAGHPATTIAGIGVTIDETAVRITSLDPLTTLSSALIGSGFTETHEILNMRVDDVPMDSSPAVELRGFAAQLGIREPFVGLMTAAKTENARLAEAALDGLTVAAVVSVGLSNRVCAGVSPPADGVPGTINAVVLVDGALTPAAMVNAVITATEAKTAALVAWDVRSPEGEPATGTSTDAVVIACTGRGEPLDYAGPATSAGWLIARTVKDAIERICGEQLERDGGRRIGW